MSYSLWRRRTKTLNAPASNNFWIFDIERSKTSESTVSIVIQFIPFFTWLIACRIILGSASSAVHEFMSLSDDMDSLFVKMISWNVITNMRGSSLWSDNSFWAKNWPKLFLFSLLHRKSLNLVGNGVLPMKF